VVPPAHGWVSPAFAIPNGITLGERERESTREDARRSPDRAGVAIGLGVDDLDAVYDYCTAAGARSLRNRAWSRLETVSSSASIHAATSGRYRSRSRRCPAEDDTGAVREEWFGPDT
jgi:hypothetical protein